MDPRGAIGVLENKTGQQSGDKRTTKIRYSIGYPVGKN